MNFLKLLSLVFLSHIALLASILTIEGTGDSQAVLKKLANEFTKLNPSIQVVIPKSIGSGGAIKNIINNTLTLGRTARALKQSEIDAGVKEIVFGLSPVVFVVHNSKINPNLSTENIIDIYSGKIKNFEDIKGSNIRGQIFQIMREAGDSSLNILQNNIVWFKDIKKYIGKIAYNTNEAKKYLIKYKNTIGYIPLGIIKNTQLKIIVVDNISATRENILNASYKLTTPFSLIYKGQLKGIEKQFVKFLKTLKAKQIMEYNGVVSTI